MTALAGHELDDFTLAATFEEIEEPPHELPVTVAHQSLSQHAVGLVLLRDVQQPLQRPLVVFRSQRPIGGQLGKPSDQHAQGQVFGRVPGKGVAEATSGDSCHERVGD